MSRALIIVDVQNDFIDGSLTVPENFAIFGPIKREAKLADLIVFTRDWHPPDHCSFSDKPKYRDGSWPPHCIQGKYGSQIDPNLWSAIYRLNKPLMIVDKGYDKHHEAYSGFEGTVTQVYNIDLLEPERLVGLPLAVALTDLDIEAVEIMGLALDYCVKATALDAANAGFVTYVGLDGTRGVGYETSIHAALELDDSNVEII